MAEFLVIISTLVALISLIAVIYLAISRPKSDSAVLEWLRMTNARLDEQARQMEATAKSLGEFSEIGRSMKELQMFLASPKLRGGLGEQVLRQLLEESLPKQSFGFQYSFRSGAKVDAIIKTASGLIPIDSKFPLENFRRMAADASFEKDFQRDVKNRIDEIAQKYIVPDEGTVDFAIMYIPSESVYYEIISSPLIDYAYKQRVMPVSPSSLYAFLRSVLLSFEGQRIAAEVRAIQQTLRAISFETEKLAGVLQTLQSHMNNTYHTLSRFSQQFSVLVSKVNNIKRLEKSEEVN